REKGQRDGERRGSRQTKAQRHPAEAECGASQSNDRDHPEPTLYREKWKVSRDPRHRYSPGKRSLMSKWTGITARHGKIALCIEKVLPAIGVVYGTRKDGHDHLGRYYKQNYKDRKDLRAPPLLGITGEGSTCCCRYSCR